MDDLLLCTFTAKCDQIPGRNPHHFSRRTPPHPHPSALKRPVLKVSAGKREEKVKSFISLPREKGEEGVWEDRRNLVREKRGRGAFQFAEVTKVLGPLRYVGF